MPLAFDLVYFFPVIDDSTSNSTICEDFFVFTRHVSDHMWFSA